MLENTMVAISSATANVLSTPSMLWGTLSTTFGTFPAVVLSILITVGALVVIKFTFSAIMGAYRNWKQNREVAKLTATQYLHAQRSGVVA